MEAQSDHHRTPRLQTLILSLVWTMFAGKQSKAVDADRRQVFIDRDLAKFQIVYPGEFVLIQNIKKMEANSALPIMATKAVICTEVMLSSALRRIETDSSCEWLYMYFNRPGLITM